MSSRDTHLVSTPQSWRFGTLGVVSEINRYVGVTLRGSGRLPYLPGTSTSKREGPPRDGSPSLAPAGFRRDGAYGKLLPTKHVCVHDPTPALGFGINRCHLCLVVGGARRKREVPFDNLIPENGPASGSVTLTKRLRLRTKSGTPRLVFVNTSGCVRSVPDTTSLHVTPC